MMSFRNDGAKGRERQVRERREEKTQRHGSPPKRTRAEPREGFSLSPGDGLNVDLLLIEMNDGMSQLLITRS